MESNDVMILGGGLAGCAAATALACAARSVQLFEREAAPRHKVCGEFLSHEALTLLANLGIDPLALGAVALRGVRLAARGTLAEAPLPFRACSLTRRTLDAALLQRACEAGVRVHRGVRVEALASDQSTWAATLSTGETATAPTVFLATGKHDLRGLPRPHGVQHDLLAFKMYFHLAPAQTAALGEYVELALFRGGYAGLQPVEGDAANLCLVLQRSRYQQLGATWPALLEAMQQECPHLRERLTGALSLLPRPLALSSIPYGLLQHDASDGLWRLGDQAAVIPSFTGDGMSIALFSGALAASMLLGGASAQDFQSTLRTHLRSQVSRATWLSRAMVSAPLQPLLAGIVRLAPAILPAVARSTRIAVPLA